MDAIAEPKLGHEDTGQFDLDELADVASRLQVEVDHRGHEVVVHTCGEVDAYTLPVWRQALREATAHVTVPGPVIVDITRLEFIACCALVALALDADVCRARGINLVVISRAPIVRRIAAAIDLDKRLDFCSTTEAALLARGHPGSGDAGSGVSCRGANA
jgi:anti-anti-sigma factor